MKYCIVILIGTLTVLTTPHQGYAQGNMIITNTEKTIEVRAGQEIKIWKRDKSSISGIYQSLSKNTLTLLSKGIESTVAIGDIKKLHVYKGSGGRGVGNVLIIAGTGGMIFGGIALVGGLAAAANDELGAIVLVAVPVLAGLGYAIRKLGLRLTGKRVKLTKKWRIVPA